MNQNATKCTDLNTKFLKTPPILGQRFQAPILTEAIQRSCQTRPHLPCILKLLVSSLIFQIRTADSYLLIIKLDPGTVGWGRRGREAERQCGIRRSQPQEFDGEAAHFCIMRN